MQLEKSLDSLEAVRSLNDIYRFEVCEQLKTSLSDLNTFANCS